MNEGEKDNRNLLTGQLYKTLYQPADAKDTAAMGAAGAEPTTEKGYFLIKPKQLFVRVFDNLVWEIAC